METFNAESVRITATRREPSVLRNIRNGLIILWCLIIALAAGLVTAAQIGIDSVPGVMPKITLGGYSVSGSNYDEILKNINGMVSQTENQTVVLEGLGGQKNTYTAQQLGVTINAEAIAKEAYGVCRSNNLFQNTWDYWKLKLLPYEISFPVTVDEKKLNSIIDSLDKKITTTRVDSEIAAKTGEITLFLQKDGVTLDKEKSTAALLAALNQIKYQNESGKEITVPLAIAQTPGNKPNIELLAATLFKQPQNAFWVKDEKGNFVLKPHEDGIMLDVALAKTLVEKATGDRVTIPLTIVKPEKTTELMQKKLFSDVLASYVTNLVVNPSRTHNVTLAADKINGVVLMPGEVFSFNKIVGPRTFETGFLEAKIYVKDEIVDGVGGGICQVTSTLYMTTLMSDLQTVQRRNHRFTVAYLPLGYDATVAYGSIDFQFKNNQDYPIKVNAYVKEQKLYVSLLGTNVQPDKKVELTTETYNPKDFSIKEKASPTLKPGETKVEQAGSKGYTVDTYKTIKIAGKVISTEKIHTSVYTPSDRIVLVGPPAVTDPTLPAVPSVPQDPSVPVVPPVPGDQTPPPVDPSVPKDPSVPADTNPPPVDPSVPVKPNEPYGPQKPVQLDPGYVIDPWLIPKG